MNAERLHAIAREIRRDLAETKEPELLQQLASSLQTLAGNPGEASYQQQLANYLKDFDAALTAAPSNDFSPAWRLTIEELGIADLLGDELRGAARDHRSPRDDSERGGRGDQ
jgi:hypothetical protein